MAQIYNLKDDLGLNMVYSEIICVGRNLALQKPRDGREANWLQRIAEDQEERDAEAIWMNLIERGG